MNEVAMKAREKVYADALALAYQTIESAARGGHTYVRFVVETLNLPSMVLIQLQEELIEQGYRTHYAKGDEKIDGHLLIDWTLVQK